MATRGLNPVLQHLRGVVLLHDGAGSTDRDLLERYIVRQDAAAFETLLRRHGPMVLGVCRRVLRNEADAEDAFQATFLVLVRKARSIRARGMVGSFLYGVAHNTALKAISMNRKRRVKEREARTAPNADAGEEVRGQVLACLDAELSRLPEMYRVPIVLCELEGQTIKEAAQQLGWPQGTLATRLSRGRALLARRLARAGLALPAGVLAAALSQSMATAGVPAELILSTTRAAGVFATGQAVSAGVISAQVAALAEGVVKSMFLTKLKSVTAALVVAGVLGVGLAGLMNPPLPIMAQQPPDVPKAPEPPKPEPPKPPVKVADSIKKLIEDLASDNFEVREKATKELIKLGVEAVPGLRQALAHQDPEVRMRSRRVLDAIMTSLTYLKDALKDPDKMVRKEAAEVLERMGDKAKEAVPLLVEALKDKDEEVREAVMMALIAIDPDNKALAESTALKATVNGKYAKLLKRIHVPQDKASYTEFSDYGTYPATDYAGYQSIPAGYWVYVYPHWYIWGEQKK